MLEINTSKHSTKKKVLVDGDKTWTVTMPGARQELQLSQTMRRAKFLENKVNNNTATSEDLDTLDKLEESTYQLYLSLFQDETDDNSQVKAWLQETPFEIVQLYLEDIKAQSQESNGSTEKTS